MLQSMSEEPYLIEILFLQSMCNNVLGMALCSYLIRHSKLVDWNAN